MLFFPILEKYVKKYVLCESHKISTLGYNRKLKMCQCFH